VNSQTPSIRLRVLQRWVVPLSLLAMMAAQCLYFAWDNGQTLDETFYNGSGYPMVRYNNYSLLGEHPPLMMQLASLPLLLLQPKYPIDDLTYIGNTKGVDLTQMGSRFLYEMGNNAELILLLERSVMIVLTLLLGFILFRWGEQLYGWRGAALALGLFTFSPNMISNGSQFMTDMGMSFFFVFTLYRAKRLFEHVTVRNALLTGLCAGLALLSKISAVLLFPILLFLFLTVLFLEPERYEQANNESPVLDRWLSVLGVTLFFLALGQKLVFVLLGPLCLIALSLCLFSVHKEKPSHFSWVEKLVWVIGYAVGFLFVFLIAQKRHLLIAASGGAWMVAAAGFYWLVMRTKYNHPVRHLAKMFVLIWFVAALVIAAGYTDIGSSLMRGNIFHHYVNAFNIASNHSLSGHGGCVEGSFVTCDWKYFLGAMSIKTPLATLALFFVGLFALWRSQIANIDKVMLIVPALIFFMFASFVNQIYIGIRHVLPVYPFLFLIAGSTLPALMRVPIGLLRKIGFASLAVILVLFVSKNVGVAPHYLTYFNELVSNEREGAGLLPVNAGQDNKRLAKLIHRLEIPSIKIGSGHNNPAEYDYFNMPWSYMNAHEYESPDPGYYAIDLDVLRRQQSTDRSWFRNQKPIDIAGRTFYLFHIPEHNSS